MTASPPPNDVLISPASPRRGWARGFGALAVRNYRLYWIGQVVTVSGSWMQQVSVPWLVVALGGSPLELASVAVLQFGPAFFLAPFGGVLADRIDKRRALVAAHVAGLVQVSVLFVLAATGLINLPLIFVMALWLGIVNGLEMPVRHSFAPDLVPRQLLPNAIALQGMAFNSARVVGPAIAGVMIGAGSAAFGSDTAGVAATLAMSILAYSAVLVALLRMDPTQVRHHLRPGSSTTLFTSLAEGLRFAHARPIVLWPMVLMAGMTAFGFNFQTLLPLFAKEVLTFDAAGYGALFACLGIGSVSGSLALAFMGRRPALLLIFGGTAAFSASLLALGLTQWPAAAFAIVFVLGCCWMLVANTVNATIQANVPDRLRGRVMALYVTVFVGSAPIGGLLAGALAEAFGTPQTFVICALLIVGVFAVASVGLRIAAGRAQLGQTRLDG